MTKTLTAKGIVASGLGLMLLACTCLAQDYTSATTNLEFTPSGSFSARCRLASRTNRACPCYLNALVSYEGTEAASLVVASGTVAKGRKVCGPFTANKILGVERQDGATPVLNVQCRFSRRCFFNAQAVESTTDAVAAVCGKGQKQLSPTDFLRSLSDALE